MSWPPSWSTRECRLLGVLDEALHALLAVAAFECVVDGCVKPELRWHWCRFTVAGIQH